jgi:3-oxoadipate enol-lactonase
MGAASTFRTYFHGAGPARLYVEEQGEGPLLVCLHGLGGGAYFFRGLGHRLKDRYRVLAIDLPGTGQSRSPGTKPFSLEACADALLDILSSHQPGSVSVLGHSMGTIIALLANAKAPGSMRSMIFAGGLPQPTERIRSRLSARAEKIRSKGMSGIGTEAAAGVFSPITQSSQPETVALFAALLDAHPAESYLESLEALIGSSAWSVLPSARLPCFTITGMEDSYAPPEEVRRFGAQLPDWRSSAELGGCGHMPFFENGEAFAAEVAGFLK